MIRTSKTQRIKCGRVKGESYPWSMEKRKVTPKLVERLMRLHERHPSWTQMQLAAHMNVSQTVVSQVLRGTYHSMPAGVTVA